MCQQNSIEALHYLQHDLSELVDHSNEAESSEFRNLTSNLFNATGTDRSQLALKVLEYFPENVKEPLENLIDLI